MSKINEIRAELDKQSEFVPTPVKLTDTEINAIIDEPVSQIIDKKQDVDNNRRLAQRILDLNPDLPAAFKSKFAVMAENSHFAKNVSLVIDDCRKHFPSLKVTDGSCGWVKLEKSEG